MSVQGDAGTLGQVGHARRPIRQSHDDGPLCMRRGLEDIVENRIKIPEQVAVRTETHAARILLDGQRRIHFFQIFWDSTRDRQHVKNLPVRDSVCRLSPKRLALMQSQLREPNIQ